MKKNFLMVASLLIAAMLLVVSCTQEVAPKNDGLVEAILAIDFGKDVTVSSLSGEKITYEYTFKPKWSTLDNGTKPFGGVEAFTKLNNTTTVAGDTVTENIGYVTPGLWELEVIGFVDYDTIKARVLAGKRTVYVNKTNTNAVDNKVTVSILVAPVSVGEGSVHLNLQMQDLNDNNKINYSIVNVDNSKKEGSMTSTTKVSSTSDAYKYEETVTKVKAGFNTISITVDGYEGGITKTFLLLPGRTINITGSVYPSQFKNVDVSIFTVDVSKGTMSIAKAGSTGTVTVTDGACTLDANTEYTFQYNGEGFNDYVTLEEKTAAGLTGEFKEAYEWYVNGKIVTGATQSSYTKDFGTAYGDYSVTCKIVYTYTEGGTVLKTWIGDASIGKIRVPAPAPTTTPTTTPEQEAPSK